MLEPDGIRLINHRFCHPNTSQFFINANPDVSACLIVQRVKGRLQYLIRSHHPKAFQRNFAIRSVGRVRRDVVQHYVASQLGHHPMADQRVQKRFENYQIADPTVDLSEKRMTSHGIYWHVLHVVLVHQDRWREIRDEKQRKAVEMIRKVCKSKGYLLGEAGILPDHVHLLMGCGFDDSPADVALCFLNNLAYAQGMSPVYQFGAYVGTLGEYDFGALRHQSLPHPGKRDGGT